MLKISGPGFSPDVKELLAFRASLICSNPDCNTLTVGPIDGQGPLATKLGEAAHICGAKKGSARYDEAMDDAERAHFDNAIWLCANCHTMIDKNKGGGFPIELLKSWKQDHTSMINALILSHRNPLPILRKITEEGKYAQDIIDLLELRGAFFVETDYEVPPYVEKAIDRVRHDLQVIIRNIKYDGELRRIAKGIAEECRRYMNETGAYQQHRWDSLKSMRNRVGILVLKLRDEYDCRITGKLNDIIPSARMGQ